MRRAVWEFDLCADLALQPAALEAAGQLPAEEHYAIKAGLAARSKARAAYLAEHGRAG